MINLKKQDAVADAVKEILQQEALKGNQDKIDANHNGKIDAQDFKILRGKKKVEEEIDTNDRTEDTPGGRKKTKQSDDVGPGSDAKVTKFKLKSESIASAVVKVLTKGKPPAIEKTEKPEAQPVKDTNKEYENKKQLRVKEDTERLEEKNWIANAIKHPGAETAAAKKSGMSVQAYAQKHQHDSGKAGKRARLAMTLKHMKEKFEEPILDELINEVMAKDASAGDYIHDFIHSDNPKFAGKSKAKRKEMALAAYYSKKNEEVVTEDRKPEKDDLDPHPIHGNIGLTKGNLRDTAYNEGLRHGAGNKHGSNAKAWGPEAKHYNAGFMAGRNDSDKWHKNMNKITRNEEAVNEGLKDVAKKAFKALTGGSDEDQRKDLQRKMGVPQTGKKPTSVEEALSKKDLLKQVGDKLNDPEFRKKPADPTKRWEKGDLFKGPGPNDYEYTGYQGHGMPRDEPKKKKAVAEGLSDTQKKIEDTTNKLEDRLKHAKSGEQWDRISARIERLQAGLNRSKRSKQGVAEGWDDMVKDAKEKVKSGPQPNGGSGKKEGSRYGGSKQKEKPEHEEVKEGKDPMMDAGCGSQPDFATNDSKPMKHAQTLAKKSLGRMRNEMLGKLAN